MSALGEYMNVRSHVCTGGNNFGADIRKLDFGQQIVSGTPDCIFEMIRSNRLRCWCIKMLIIDEADELLKNKFKDQIYDIFRSLQRRPVQGVY